MDTKGKYVKTSLAFSKLLKSVMVYHWLTSIWPVVSGIYLAFKFFKARWLQKIEFWTSTDRCLLVLPTIPRIVTLCMTSL